MSRLPANGGNVPPSGRRLPVVYSIEREHKRIVVYAVGHRSAIYQVHERDE